MLDYTPDRGDWLRVFGLFGVRRFSKALTSKPHSSWSRKAVGFEVEFSAPFTVNVFEPDFITETREIAETTQRKAEIQDTTRKAPDFANSIRPAIVKDSNRLAKVAEMEVTKALAALQPLYGKGNIEIVTRDGHRVRGVVRSLKSIQALTTPSVRVQRADGEVVRVAFSSIVEIIDYNPRA